MTNQKQQIGRPRNFVTNADRQRAYRERQKAEKDYYRQLEALRNSEPQIRYTWIKTYLVIPGDECMYCGRIVQWSNVPIKGLHGRLIANNRLEWNLSSNPCPRFIEVRRVALTWLRCWRATVCPDCQQGQDHDKEIAVRLFQGEIIKEPVNPFDKSDENWARAVRAGVER